MISVVTEYACQRGALHTFVAAFDDQVLKEWKELNRHLNNASFREERTLGPSQSSKSIGRDASLKTKSVYLFEPSIQ